MAEINQDTSKYQSFYEERTTDATQLNFGSVAIVCNIKADKAKQILTDLFACMIELRRKHKNSKDIRVNMKSFGYLNVAKNG
jgi:hypothetical protein